MDKVVTFANKFPNVTKGESKLFLKFLLKNDLYNQFMTKIFSEQSKNSVIYNPAHLLFLGVRIYDIARLDDMIADAWYATYKREYFEKTLREWEYHVLEIMAKHDIPFGQYYEDQHVLYAPSRAELSIKKYINKRFSKRLSQFIQIRTTCDFRGQLWLRIEFSMFPRININ